MPSAPKSAHSARCFMPVTIGATPNSRGDRWFCSPKKSCRKSPEENHAEGGDRGIGLVGQKHLPPAERQRVATHRCRRRSISRGGENRGNIPPAARRFRHRAGG